MTDTAKTAGVHITTLYAWRKTGWFKRVLLAEKQKRLLNDPDAVLALAYEATEALREDLQSPRPETRIRAARQLAAFYRPTYEAILNQRKEKAREQETRERIEAARQRASTAVKEKGERSAEPE